MATRHTVVDRAARIAMEDQRRVLADIARAQLAAGLSDAAIAEACQTSRWTVARIVSGAQAVDPVALAKIGAVVGVDVRTRAYPAGDPIRDAGQQRLLGRLRSHLHPSIAMRLEIPLGIEGDRRAWDAMLQAATWREPAEAETVVDDVQALERRLRLKMRDGGEDRLILVIAATRRNRRALDAAPLAFAGFQRNARRVLAALRSGRDPGGSAILFL